jgi:Fe(3+) dicitrate transport protein
MVSPAVAEGQYEPDSARKVLPNIVVTEKATNPEREPFLPPVQGARINAGKKSVNIDLGKMPEISNNNYRQALAMTPGLVLAEDVTPLLSVGYRGLNPYRSQFTQVLKDGIPITMDMFGYPEAYYTPPLDGVDRIEFLHGGASLMYGPQPGGSLNYISPRPRANEKIVFHPRNIVGSDNLYSTYNSIDGTIDRVGYHSYFHHRQTNGFRKANSDLDLFAGSAKFVVDPFSHSRWIVNADAYTEEHGEAGGLTLATGPNAVNYSSDRNASSRLFDRFRLDRAFGSVGWERDFSETLHLVVQGWNRYNYRLSRRQLGGGFGTVATGPNAAHNAIQLQRFYNSGLDARLRRDWSWGGNTNSLAAGGTFYYTHSPRTDKLGATPDAKDGALQSKTSRNVYYTPLFVENLFRFGKLSVTPGVRLENVWQHVDEEVNIAKTAAGIPLGDRSEYAFVPLLGLGAEYAVKPRTTIYGNLSQSYRPKLFTESVPTEPNTVINADLEEGKSWQAEFGVRSNPHSYMSWDVSAFMLDFTDQIGAVTLGNGTSSLENVGDATHKGVEAAFQIDLLALTDAVRSSKSLGRFGSFSVYGNLMLLDAEFVAGPQKGKTPQHAPDFIYRTGAIYSKGDRVRLAMLGTFNGEQFADDNNTQLFRVPGYSVWDLTFESKVNRSVGVLAGANNLFNRKYYARIRSDGIDPAAERNYYAGLSLTL